MSGLTSPVSLAFFFQLYADLPDLNSFPTRRSSDRPNHVHRRQWRVKWCMQTVRCPLDLPGDNLRSEKHTSELQSHLNLVCRLLLEKKKNCTQSVTCFTIYRR